MGDAAALHRAAFGSEPDVVAAAPGRINLIGEHTDYNGGFVLPIAIGQRTEVAASWTGDGEVAVISSSAGGPVRFPVTTRPGEVGGWASYVAGVIWSLRRAGHPVGGARIAVASTVPMGAGLSLSAALEAAVAVALTDPSVEPADLVRVAHDAEVTYVGVPCGVMDQTVVLTARAGHALLLDVSRLESRHIPLQLSDHDLALMVVDTRVSHRLSDGGYGARRRECEAAAVVLGLPTLREADMASVDDPALPDHLRARVRHVVTENARVLEVARLLEEGADPRLVGTHLTASHASMRDDFEITVPEVDAAVAAALGAGAYGARMTGGGFGGCVIALLETAALGSVGRAVATAFQPEGWVPPVVFEAEASAGATRVEL